MATMIKLPVSSDAVERDYVRIGREADEVQSVFKAIEKLTNYHRW
jgi:hypothetical protein